MNSDSSNTPSENLESKYRILRRLAVGGMAEIYLAESTQMHGFRKKVVIKRILPQFANDPMYVEMFLDEARLVAQLNPPSIVQVFDIGEESDGVFFTMEYVEGRDLADILGTCYKQKRQLSLEEVLAIAVPTAEALHHSHELCDDHGDFVNLVHRDVTPSNVIVTNEGRVKLLDFGVAKSKSQLRATTGVSLKGKFGYMAPEQCQGLTLDRRSDIFSFGVVLWELFAGKRLFPGGNEPSVLMRIMDGNFPAPTSVRPDLPTRLDQICLRALATDRNDRYLTLDELLSDLDEFRRENGVVTTSRTLSSLITTLFGAPAKQTDSQARASLPLPPAAPDKDPSINISIGAEPAQDRSPMETITSTPGRWTPRPGIPFSRSAPVDLAETLPQLSTGIPAPAALAHAAPAHAAPAPAAPAPAAPAPAALAPATPAPATPAPAALAHATPAPLESGYADPSGLNSPYADPSGLNSPYVDPSGLNSPYADPSGSPKNHGKNRSVLIAVALLSVAGVASMVVATRSGTETPADGQSNKKSSGSTTPTSAAPATSPTTPALTDTAVESDKIPTGNDSDNTASLAKTNGQQAEAGVTVLDSASPADRKTEHQNAAKKKARLKARKAKLAQKPKKQKPKYSKTKKPKKQKPKWDPNSPFAPE